MYSKSFRFATYAAVLCVVGCQLPWANQPIGDEVNLAFVLRDNLVVARALRIDGRPGRFVFGSAEPTTLIDPRFAPSPAPHSLQLNERHSVPLSSIAVDLKGVADAIIGADVWDSHSLTIDYGSGLVTYQRDGIHAEGMTIYRYQSEPMITINVDGRTIPAIVDTASPDTLLLSGEKSGRRIAHVRIADTDFGNVDVRVGDVAVPRVGNRLLSKFLVSIDYGRHIVGLWRDPRIAL